MIKSLHLASTHNQDHKSLEYKSKPFKAAPIFVKINKCKTISIVCIFFTYLLFNKIFRKGWVKATKDKNPWIQVELDHGFQIAGVLTRGRYGQWVSTYQISYSSNGINWTDYQEQAGADKVIKALVSSL